MRFDDYNFKARYKKHPLLSNFSDILPSNIKELFRWMEFILHNSPVAAAGIKKLSEVPVTSFRYSSTGDKKEGTATSSESWKTILEKSLNLKSELLNISYNTLAYGNCFISVYTPIDRRCTCRECQGEWSILNLAKVKVSLNSENDGYNPSEMDYFSHKKEKDSSKLLKKKKKRNTRLKISAMCPNCRAVRTFDTKDEHIKSHKDMNIITWDPNSIQISSNKVSGKTDFFYTIPPDTKNRLKGNDLSLLSTLPLPMIEAALSGKLFKFADGHIFHMKKEVVSGLSTAWGMPSLASAIPPFMTLMILRKANETIASDYMVPLRIVSPSQAGSGSDMYNFVGGGNFVSNVKRVIDSWKIDPSGVQVSPTPLNVETILGDGKILSVYQDVDQLESNIANSLGIPLEFIKGGLSYTTQGSSLRLLENQLENITSSLERVIDFVVGRVASALAKEPISISMVPFKIIDDMQEKAAILNLALNGQNSVSRATILEMFNMDSTAEKERIEEDKRSDIKSQMDMQNYTRKVSSSIEEQAANDAQMSTSSFEQLNQQKLMTEAQSYVDELTPLDDGQRRSKLDEMSKTNYIMYGVVKALLDMSDNKLDYANKLQAEQQNQQQ